jgi:amidohydrolase
MDALPGVGHACGHNLIAISGVAVAIAAKEALVEFGIDGKIVLLGTPAEEGGYGKVLMMEKGAYKDMDVCLMCHPAPGPQWSASLSSCLALNRATVEFKGHSAHAGLSPWEGTNALDAAVLAYNNISVLRQQIKPTHRIHGIFHGTEWAPNIVPDNSSMNWLIRAPTRAEVIALAKRVTPCFQAAALATGCKVEVKEPTGIYDLRQNKALGDELTNIYHCRYGSVNMGWGIASASTDFGNVTYELPSIHPGFAIPTVANGGNHTPEFTQATKTPEAHKATLNISKALAAIGVRTIADDRFFAQVVATFEEDKKQRDQEFKAAGV